MYPHKIKIALPMPADFDLWNDFNHEYQERSRLALANFYDNLFSVLRSKNQTLIKTYMSRQEWESSEFPIPKNPTSDEIYFSYHTYDKPKFNVYHVHLSGLSGYFTVDKKGYAGFSINATSDEEYQKSKLVDIDVARRWFKDFSHQIITSGLTKVVQKQSSLNVESPYIFIAGQTKGDAVIQKLSNVDGQAYYNKVSDMAQSLGYNVVFKNHPLSKEGYNDFHAPKGSIVYDGDIHKAIAGADAVFVINSSVGLEALLHNKRVITAGKCDYSWITNHIKSLDELDDGVFTTRIDTDAIAKFLYHMVVNVYVDVYDRKSIDMLADKILFEYFSFINTMI